MLKPHIPDEAYERCRRMIENRPKRIDSREYMTPVESSGAMMLSVLTLVLTIVSLPYVLAVLAAVILGD